MKKRDEHDRLFFFRRFLRAMDLNYYECGQILGVTKSAICSMFNSDDTSLSTIHKVATACGYRLNVILTRTDDPTDTRAVAFEDCLRLSGVRLQPSILTFLLIAMSRYSISKRQLAEDVGITRSSVRQWFRKQDIKISALVKIAAMEKLNITFEFVEIEKDNTSNDSPDDSISVEYIIPIQGRCFIRK